MKNITESTMNQINQKLISSTNLWKLTHVLISLLNGDNSGNINIDIKNLWIHEWLFKIIDTAVIQPVVWDFFQYNKVGSYLDDSDSNQSKVSEEEEEKSELCSGLTCEEHYLPTRLRSQSFLWTSVQTINPHNQQCSSGLVISIGLPL